MRNILKLGIFLLVVAGVAGLALSYVNTLTEPIVISQEQENKINSFKEVYPEAETVKDESSKYLKSDEQKIITEVNVAYKNGNPVGVIYTVEPKGYAGAVRTLVGFDIAAKKITAIKVLSQKETPGLGAKSSEASFMDRFKGKSAESAVEIIKKEPVNGNQVLAITAATITSKAVASGVNAAREHFIANFVKS